MDDFTEIEETVFDEQACRKCGCTWNNACSGGCYWVEEDLCSECVEKEVPEEMKHEDFRAFDIVRVEPYSAFCGLDEGVYKGTVIHMKGEAKPVIIFNGIGLSRRADRNGVAPYLNFEAWGNCYITLLYRSTW